MCDQSCRALKMLSFGIFHKLIGITEVTKKSNLGVENQEKHIIYVGHLEFGAAMKFAHTFARGMGAKYFLNPSRTTNPLRNQPMLSTVTEVVKSPQLFMEAFHDLL